MTCSQAVFDQLLSDLDDHWAEELVKALASAPTKAGISFGSSYSVLGSIGITDVENVSLILDTNNVCTQFSTCGIQDYAVLIVPLTNLSFDFTTKLRASYAGHIWPDSQQETYEIPGYVSGFFIASVDVNDSGIFDWPNIRLDLRLTGQWNQGFLPDGENVIFSSVPFQALMDQYTTALAKHLKEHFLPKLRFKVQRNKSSENCDIPVAPKQECTSTVSPVGPCDACDVCCKCFMQQRCDGECKDCACVSCTLQNWSFMQALATLLMIIVSLAILAGYA